jgi:hypothetical protein
MRLLAACAIAVALMTGCDTTQSAPGDEAARTTTTRQDRKPLSLFPFTEGASSASVIGEGAARRPVEKLYGVFRRSQSSREAEIKPQVAAYSACPAPDGAGSEEIGRTITQLTRILLSDVGRGQDVLVAVPTTTDYVGITLFSSGGGNCGRPLTKDGLMLALQVDEARFAIVYGMVSDDVASVDLVVDGKHERAQLGENGFALEIPDAPNKTLEKLVLKHHDGSVTEFPSTE